jgi:hypothetical protein
MKTQGLITTPTRAIVAYEGRLAPVNGNTGGKPIITEHRLAKTVRSDPTYSRTEFLADLKKASRPAKKRAPKAP